MAKTDPLEKPLEPLFPRLSGGPGSMTPEEVTSNQKARLEGAMVEAVARHGFAPTTVRELVTLAGVSKSTFYDHFEGKEACFLATFEEILTYVSREVLEAFGSSGDFRERLAAALRRCMELVVERPKAATLATVDSLTLGAGAVAHRERSWDAFEEVIREYFLAASEEPVSDLTVRAIVGGISGVVYRRMRKGTFAELSDLVDPLIDWALSYQGELSGAVKQAAAAAERTARPLERPGGELNWEEPPDSPLSRATLSQRERIIRAAARVVVERGYASLSIPAISAAAGTSNQTFYENFNSKREAILAAYEFAAGDVLAVASAAFERESDAPEAVGAGLRALTEYIAGHPLFSRLAFFELPMAGPPALDQSDATMDSFLAFLDAEEGGPTGTARQVALEASGAGIWFVIQSEIANGNGGSLPAVAPELARIALAPLTAR